MLELRIQAFSLPKEGLLPEECEDACAYDAVAQRLALADGASDGFESQLWAEALVQRFVRQPPPLHREALLEWLAAPREVWKKGIQWEQLPWYAEAKARRGAFATLLGVTFAQSTTDPAGEDAATAHWQAMSVGDACLFQLRGGEMVVHFPIERATDFGTTPPLLSTRADYNVRSVEALQIREGQCWPGDLFVLATDALAAWFLSQVEAGQYPWQRVVDATTESFATLLANLRHMKAMRNDDVTLILARMEGAETPHRPATASGNGLG